MPMLEKNAKNVLWPFIGQNWWKWSKIIFFLILKLNYFQRGITCLHISKWKKILFLTLVSPPLALWERGGPRVGSQILLYFTPIRILNPGVQELFMEFKKLLVQKDADVANLANSPKFGPVKSPIMAENQNFQNRFFEKLDITPKA